jgi:hypothetical protein
MASMAQAGVRNGLGISHPARRYIDQIMYHSSRLVMVAIPQLFGLNGSADFRGNHIYVSRILETKAHFAVSVSLDNGHFASSRKLKADSIRKTDRGIGDLRASRIRFHHQAFGFKGFNQSFKFSLLSHFKSLNNFVSMRRLYVRQNDTATLHVRLRRFTGHSHSLPFPSINVRVPSSLTRMNDPSLKKYRPSLDRNLKSPFVLSASTSAVQ